MIDKLKAVAERMNSRFTAEYSGRGMNGQTCLAIITEHPEDVIAEAGIKGARVDDMGLRSVVYWPRLNAKDTQ